MRLRLSEKEKDDFLIRLVAIFKKAKAKKLKGRSFDYRVKDYRFKIYPSEHLFVVFYKQDDKPEKRISCNNEDNVIERTEHIVKQLC
jgi:hypothetical protein